MGKGTFMNALAKIALLGSLTFPTIATADCDRPFNRFVADLEQEAIALGYTRRTVQSFFDGVTATQVLSARIARKASFNCRLSSFHAG